MSTLFGGVIEALRQASAYALRRHEILAENVANTDTPGFKAHDLSFAHELDLAQTVQSRPDSTYGPGMDLRIVAAPDGPARTDGNDVDLDKEMGRLSQNTLYHNVVVHLLNARFAAMKSAINGR
ncbi:MAG: flagellar basal body rod protein FlgB [Candidatus Rokubacteria bacterium]|nr:flagellar basal body rod protein FlgB [Candidatus Rokubacteria bacterium]MBI4594641.1 flagellar basal body rod protein FlgB [Candidatus Rokubacteria bacterium]